jgi:copper chaperone CopZ
MCKSTIEATVSKIDGVKSVRWNTLTLNMNVKYNSAKTTLNFIKESIANVGYDTDNYKAAQETYNNLHHCCKYDRN